MNSFKLPTPPKDYRLEKAFLSTFDLDENILLDLVGSEDLDKYLFVRGDGEYIPIKNENEALKKRIVEVFYKATNKKLPNGKFQPEKYFHAKIWLFVYRNDNGDKVSKLRVQSKNIYPYDSLEVELDFTGQQTKEKQSKNEPLVAYLQSLLPFMNEEQKEFVAPLIEDLPYYSYKLDKGDYEAEGFSFIAPTCQDIPLLQEEYDEILVIAPFINVASINDLLSKKKEGGRCIILSQAKILESLILRDVQGVQFVSPSIDTRFVHAKMYLVRKGDRFDLYAGSMNLSEYAIAKNTEAMVRLQNVKGITSIEGFLQQLFGDAVIDELEQYRDVPNQEGISAVFNNAFKIETRIRYIQRLLENQKYEEERMNRISTYLLSSRSAKDLMELATFKKEIIPTRLQVLTGKDKKRLVYKLSFEDNVLLGLINYSLHQYDHLFSKNVFLHILDRSVDNAFIKIHQTEGLKDYYFFKTDIHDFDPSIDKGILCTEMDKALGFDEHFCRFAKSIINESRYRLEGEEKIYTDDTIHQTGLPLGGFFENVYLRDFDFAFDKAPLYIRCGDDVLIGSKDKTEIETLSQKAISLLKEKKLSISENKTAIASPGETIPYLGWSIGNGQVDFDEGVLDHIQKTIKKKTKNLLVMFTKNGVPNAFRLPAVLKFVHHYQKSEYIIASFKIVTTTSGLKMIDEAILDLIRTVVTGKTGSGKYKLKYATIQKFGYRSLVNQYYAFISGKK